MKLKKSSIEGASAEAQTGTGGGAFISARLRNPADELAAKSTGGSDTIYAVAAMIATVVMVIVTALVYFNWDAIKSA